MTRNPLHRTGPRLYCGAATGTARFAYPHSRCNPENAMASQPDTRVRRVGLVAGLAVGILWIILAASALLTSWQGAREGRGDWALGWGLVGGLLMAAGLAAIIGTCWHIFRVLPRDRA
jgi:hypothetical protein